MVYQQLQLPMTASPDKKESQSNLDREQKIYNNPFSKRFNTKRDKAPIEQYIKAWIEDIFYYNKKIDIQAKATIYRKLISEKFYELSSCSMVYSIIREKIKEICFSLRKFINHSYEKLKSQSQYLCNIVQEQGGNKKRKPKADQESKNINLPLSKIFVISYRYMCEVAKETFHFWKILYQCTQVKDLRFHSLQTSLNQFILETFVQSNEAFKPKIMLQSMSFHQKCKFIYADVEGIKKRQELTHFDEDQTAKKLFLKKQDKKDGLIQRQLARMRFEFQPQQTYPFSKKIQSFFHKPRMDYKDIEHLRTYYLQTEQTNEENLFNSLFSSINPENNTNRVKDITFSQQKLDLIKSLECNNDKLFQIEDASSEDQIQEHLYYENEIESKEDLIDEQDQLERELSMNHEKMIQNGQTQGSSKSELIEQAFQMHDLPMKNYQHEPTPPQFIIPENISNISREEHYEYILQRERAQMQRAIELLTQYSHEANKSESEQQEEPHQEKIAKLKINIARSKQIRNKEKKIQFLDKRQLEEEKEKLQKYRRELQKEKEELLREVQKFMKEKKKETNLLALIKENKYKHKIKGASFKYSANHKIIHKLQKHQQKIESISLRYDLNAFHEQEQEHSAQLDSIAHIIDDKSKMKEIQDAVAKDLIQNTKLTKKQQKLKKKQDHKAVLVHQQTVEPPKVQKNIFTEQEASLNTFLQRLQIDDDNRVNCNVEQAQILKWKMRANDFLSGQEHKIPPPTSPKQNLEAKVESGRKKKKNKR